MNGPESTNPPIASASSPASSSEMNDLTNTELIFFLESSFHRSEFARAAEIVKSREESANAQAEKILREETSARDATIADLRGKNESIVKELAVLRTMKNELEEEIRVWKNKYARLEVWVLRLLDDNPGLVERERALKKVQVPPTMSGSFYRTELLINVSDDEDGG